MKKLDLRLFAGGHSVTLYYDAGISSASASSDTDVQQDAEVTLTVSVASGKEIAEYEVISGGVTVNATTKKFTMGEADVVIYIKTKASNLYQVTEECMVCVNDDRKALHCNTKVLLTPNGAVKGAEIESNGITLTLTPAVQSLIDQGILVKL